MLSDEKHRVLKRYFGYTSFREGQAEIIDNIMNRRDVLAVMPTGGGKSLCYEIPAIMQNGVTIVISPLISLMRDQVSALNLNGIKAVYFSSSMDSEQRLKIETLVKCGKYKLIYTAPERLMYPNFIDLCRSINIKLIAVDEAHCVSQWGHNFRPGYLDIRDFIDSLEERPTVAAFTATATPRVRRDIAVLLGLHEPFSLTAGYDRPNLFFSVIREPEDKLSTLASLANERAGRSGIVYCSTRDNAEMTAAFLKHRGIAARPYHAGLEQAVRDKVQEKFIGDKISVITATSAFGMGIDKSNVSYVIHYNITKDIESYYQESGRSGRDGSPAECILIYSSEDEAIQSYLIDRCEPNERLTLKERHESKQNERERLKKMIDYCIGNHCLRSCILEYFGEKPITFCGRCSNCLDRFRNSDITADAIKIMSCVVGLKQQYDIKTATGVLKGESSEFIINNRLDSLKTYGIMSDYTLYGIEHIINTLISGKYLEASSDGKSVLRLTSLGISVLNGEGRIYTDGSTTDKNNLKECDGELGTDEYRLFKKLAALRKKLADKISVPPYALVSDQALSEMCRKKPGTLREFSEASGMSGTKLEKYGNIFLREINK